jgi:hypothetical protein
VEASIAIFTGIGSVLIGVTALRLQHLADVQILLWPDLRYRNGHKHANFRAVVGPAIEPRIALVFEDSTWAPSDLPLLEQGENWDVYRIEAGTGLGHEAPVISQAVDVAGAVVWIRSRTSQVRWHAWAVSTTAGESLPSRQSQSFWSLSPPSPDQVLKRFGVQVGGAEVQVVPIPGGSNPDDFA